jgi:indoleamine 2,3-dioxygenase
MSVSTPSSSFDILSDTRPDDHSIPAFMVSTSRGFLPRAEPIVKLPQDFDALESILSRMPIKTASGAPGLLASGDLGAVVQKELPDLSVAIEKYHHDLPLMNALYRDYSFLASAYLLEPCKSIIFSPAQVDKNDVHMSYILTTPRPLALHER